uniref:Secreted protein n=1 Tax=Haemonchus contortus TaxID=6289 RepID=A0A7I4YLY7_HAECO
MDFILMSSTASLKASSTMDSSLMSSTAFGSQCTAAPPCLAGSRQLHHVIQASSTMDFSLMSSTASLKASSTMDSSLMSSTACGSQCTAAPPCPSGSRQLHPIVLTSRHAAPWISVS